MQAKMETAAEKYRRIKEDRLRETELHDFESPSGMTWKLRKPDIAQFVVSGMLPMSLAAKIAEQQNGGATEEQLTKSLSTTEMCRTIEFSAKIVRYCAVSPRIVETPSGPDEIGYEEVEIDDFNAILHWARGGGEADILASFPG